MSEAANVKALHELFRLRARRAKLAANPPDTQLVTYERFTPAEMDQLSAAERVVNRLNGVPAIELLIANRSTLLSYLVR